ncbi:MAG: response regulator [Fibrobacterota bacterium]
MNQSHYSVSEIAKILVLSKKSVRDFCAQGKIEAESTEIKDFYRIPHEKLIRYMLENKIPLDHINMLKKKKIRKVLIVDDTPAIILLLENLLDETYSNLIIETANDGYAANLKASVFVPDVMFIDIQMPRLNGAEVCRNLRSLEETKAIDIIVMTGYSTQENITTLQGLNIRKILVKPFTLQSVINAVGPLLD